MSRPVQRRPRSPVTLSGVIWGSATLALTFSALVASCPTQAAGGPVRVALGAFTGDEQLTAAVTETLLTDLAKCSKISVRGNREAEDDGALRITGSCLAFDNNVVINVRIIDPATGQSVPGAAENVDGPRSQVFTLVHNLAGRLCARVAGEPQPPSSNSAQRPGGRFSIPLKPSLGLSAPRINLGGASSRSAVVSARPKPPVIARPAPPSAVMQPNSVRMDPEDSTINAEVRHPDADPIGGLVRDPESNDRGDSRDPVSNVRRSGDSSARYTSLIIDARGLDLERSMSPSIRRRDGSVVWNGEDANPDMVISEGIVVYAETMRQARQLDRAGSRPLVIDAVSRHEVPFPSDPYVEDDDAEYLLKAARHDGFLRKFRVIFVVGR